MSGKPEIRLNSVFTFDDHIRCMAAKQHLVRARERLVFYDVFRYFITKKNYLRNQNSIYLKS